MPLWQCEVLCFPISIDAIQVHKLLCMPHSSSCKIKKILRLRCRVLVIFFQTKQDLISQSNEKAYGIKQNESLIVAFLSGL